KYWENLAQGSDTLCIYMGMRNLTDICEKLIQYGRPSNTPVAVIHWGTTEKQQTITGTLENIVKKLSAIKTPSMIIIGNVVRLRNQINRFKRASTEQELNPEITLGCIRRRLFAKHFICKSWQSNRRSDFRSHCLYK